jgi:hypothetical protein
MSLGEKAAKRGVRGEGLGVREAEADGLPAGTPAPEGAGGPIRRLAIRFFGGAEFFEDVVHVGEGEVGILGLLVFSMGVGYSTVS